MLVITQLCVKYFKEVFPIQVRISSEKAASKDSIVTLVSGVPHIYDYIPPIPEDNNHVIKKEILTYHA